MNTVSESKPQLVSIENAISTAVYEHYLFINIQAKVLKTHSVHYSLRADGVTDTSILMIYKR